MTMRSIVTPTSSRTLFMRSCVMGRWVTMPWSAKAMAVASTGPIQIGRKRSPSRSRSNTIGWFVGSSTRTPCREQVRQRQPRIDDVFDQDDIVAGNRLVEVLEDPHNAGIRPIAVGADRHEVDVDRRGDRAREIGHEDE